VKPDWFVLGADRSAKWYGETVDSHHMGGKTTISQGGLPWRFGGTTKG
jgi:hypothetical protein